MLLPAEVGLDLLRNQVVAYIPARSFRCGMSCSKVFPKLVSLYYVAVSTEYYNSTRWRIPR